jgi:polysaccharide biosynthesis protein VpsM
MKCTETTEMATKTLTLAVIMALTGGATRAFADAGTGIQAGPFRVKPTIGLSLVNDSNVTLAEKNEISSFVTRISPGIRLDAGNEIRSFSLSYEIESGRYSSNAAKRDNYTDHNLAAGVRLSPSARSAIELGAEYVRGHDRRGENARQGLLANYLNLDSDKWRSTGAHAAFTYGAPEARFNFGLLGGFSNLAYRNNRSYTIFGDRDENFLEGRVGYRLAPKTSLYVSARNNKIDFDRSRQFGTGTISIDSSERIYLVGVQFDATAKLSGHVGVGRSKKNFDDSRISDYSGTAWDAGLQFRPRTYSVIDLSTSRRTDEGIDFLSSPASNGNSAYLLARDITLAWTHGWSDRLHSTLDFGRERSAYVGYTGATPREDTFRFYGLSADYSLNAWLSFGAGYKNYARDSNLKAGATNPFDYKRNEFLLSFEGTL